MENPLDVGFTEAVQPGRYAEPPRRVVVAQLQLVMSGEQVRRYDDVEQAGVEEHVLRLLALGVRVVVENEDFFRHGLVAGAEPIRSSSSP